MEDDKVNLKDKPKSDFALPNLDFFKNHKMPNPPKNMVDFKLDDIDSFRKKIKGGFRS